MVYPLNIKNLDLLNYKNIKNFYNFKHYLKVNQFKYILYKFLYSFFFFINFKNDLLKIKNILSFFQFKSQKYERTFFLTYYLTKFTIFASTNIDKQVINLVNFINVQKDFFLNFIKINKNLCIFNFVLNIISIQNKLSYKIFLFTLLFLIKVILINFKNLINLCQH